MPRVLSTDTARSSITALASIINGGLADQISQVDQHGRTLSQPDVWDGGLAVRFRSTMPEMSRRLQAVRNDLDQLRADIDRINADIMAAGG
ncbi:MAG: hypothetical protein KDB02_11045, partial [Acidimicrobiales bacterium]|nr:hypothetical protein [Acidimicrobiales bacterium]